MTPYQDAFEALISDGIIDQPSLDHYPDGDLLLEVQDVLSNPGLLVPFSGLNAKGFPCYCGDGEGSAIWGVL